MTTRATRPCARSSTPSSSARRRRRSPSSPSSPCTYHHGHAAPSANTAATKAFTPHPAPTRQLLKLSRHSQRQHGNRCPFQPARGLRLHLCVVPGQRLVGPCPTCRRSLSTMLDRPAIALARAAAPRPAVCVLRGRRRHDLCSRTPDMLTPGWSHAPFDRLVSMIESDASVHMGDVCM